RFDVYLCQRRDAGQYPFGATAIRVATAVDMRRGPVNVALTTGLRVVAPEGMPPPDCWFVTWTGSSAPAIVAERLKSLDPVWLLPGRYDIFWVQSDTQRDAPAPIAVNVEVRPGQLT